ncbi:hypothetical protein DV515_00012623 [Chloebia gouldiae]|uniref:Uncharacterized protein n=1 Tax=Chloebia gouldiae TaxID=44316 RepID=A0A3L8S329_CHLGU|nr:hypothetical protein DV515_00012623 [Chloebia gouldiae]
MSQTSCENKKESSFTAKSLEVPFPTSDDTEDWNKKCSNPLPAPLQLPKCPTKAEADPQDQQGCELQSQGSPCSTLLKPLLLTSQQSSCPAHTPDRSFPTHSLRPALKKTPCPVPLLGVTTASKVETEQKQESSGDHQCTAAHELKEIKALARGAFHDGLDADERAHIPDKTAALPFHADYTPSWEEEPRIKSHQPFWEATMLQCLQTEILQPSLIPKPHKLVWKRRSLVPGRAGSSEAAAAHQGQAVKFFQEASVCPCLHQGSREGQATSPGSSAHKPLQCRQTSEQGSRVLIKTIIKALKQQNGAKCPCNPNVPKPVTRRPP